LFSLICWIIKFWFLSQFWSSFKLIWNGFFIFHEKIIWGLIP
jgi:hypothetical protein